MDRWLSRLLPHSAAASEAQTIVFVIACMDERHHAAFVDAGGVDVVQRLVQEGRDGAGKEWDSTLETLRREWAN